MTAAKPARKKTTVRAAKRTGTNRIVLLVGTRKGAWLLHSDGPVAIGVPMARISSARSSIT